MVVGKVEERRWNSILNLSWATTSSGSISTLLIVFIFFLGVSSAATLSLSDQMPHSTGRRILQAQQACPVSFENLNYTIITSRCKGPKYPPNECCAAFKDFACPYADQLNDQQNNCATTMFSYINLYGKYPPGLFANECYDSKRGLECTDAQVKDAQVKGPPHPYSAAQSAHLPRFVLSAVTFLPILWHLQLL